MKNNVAKAMEKASGKYPAWIERATAEVLDKLIGWQKEAERLAHAKRGSEAYWEFLGDKIADVFNDYMEGCIGP